MSTTARVFPRQTTASPLDDLAFYGPPPEGLHVDEAHISVAFTYDIPKAQLLAEEWGRTTHVKISGPALGDPGGEFTPGEYLREGYVLTSRGCPNNCWFCDVPKREGDIRELKVNKGWNLLDSNILACSKKHIRKVFKMLSAQVRRPQFTGGLEAARLAHWHVELLWAMRPAQMFFAYDTPDDYDPLVEAGKLLRYANFTRRHLRCYVLIGHPKDTRADALKRLVATWKAGFMPMAMLWRGKDGFTTQEWRRFQRDWARPALTKRLMQETGLPK